MLNTKYEPQRFADIIFQNDIARKRLQRYAKGSAKGCVLLHGPCGTAKSTAARIVAQQARRPTSSGFAIDVDFKNGADFDIAELPLIERGWNMSGQAYAYAVIDEVDLLRPRDQSKLRALIDKYQGQHGFIFTTNNIHHVEGAILSRCDVIEMPALTADALLPMCQHILKQEGHKIDDQRILNVMMHVKGDIRTALNKLDDVIHQI